MPNIDHDASHTSVEKHLLCSVGAAGDQQNAVFSCQPRSPFLGSHLAASVDGAWVEHKVQHQNYDWKLLTSIGKVMKL